MISWCGRIGVLLIADCSDSGHSVSRGTSLRSCHISTLSATENTTLPWFEHPLDAEGHAPGDVRQNLARSHTHSNCTPSGKVLFWRVVPLPPPPDLKI
ncbi:hypothetical protein BDN72DRAFT_389936 [Pluteus cervinus]|uniref:Uncharacterized protein n=1 Tax=Pluteus cervinus TaxID=181527 RepID=A0ACD3B2J9_9AGAR|nr:hypothetical protein BDN72DRAFT_389936 [Pluteus cervinus]